jgi:hypothetical protein
MAARAFESFEEMSGIDGGLSLVGVMLEEFLAGLGVADAAEDAELRIVQIADGSAVVSMLRGRINLD